MVRLLMKMSIKKQQKKLRGIKKMIRMASSRDAYGDKLIELGYKIPNLIVMDADLSSSTKTIKFKSEFPDRHFNLGVAESNLMLFAAGASLTNKIVFVSSFAMFATGRAWEMIRNTIAHDRLNVKIVASHSGVAVGEDGYSHQATEDIAIIRAIPEMKVFSPADAFEVQKIIEYIAYKPGPFYVRLSRENSPLFLDTYDDYEFQEGKFFQLSDGNDATIFSTGTVTYFALEAVEELKKIGINVRLFNASSIKPIDKDSIIKSARETGCILTVEDHNIIGGLGSAVSEVVSENCPVLVKRLGIPDVFGTSGKPKELFKLFGLTTDNIIENIKYLIKNKK